MSKTMKIVSILMIAIMLVMVATPVFALNTTDINDAITGVDNNAKAPSDGTIKEKVGKLLGTVQWIGIVGGVLILAVLGIKYMMGSLEEKAEYKKSFIPFIVGAVIVAGAPTIANIIFKLLK